MVVPIKNWWISSELIYKEALKKGFEVNIINKEKNLFEVSSKWKTILFKSVDCAINSSLWFKIAEDKELTYTLCEKIWVPYPKTEYMKEGTDYEIHWVLNTIHFPLITKPFDWAHGDGVSIWITSKELLQKGFQFARNYTTWKVVVQEQITWFDHRILVLWDKVIAGAIRIPPYVTGNWKNTVLELINEENKNPRRGWWDDHDSIMSKIRIDNELYETLEKEGYTQNSILEKDKELFVRRNCNLSTGWLSINITKQIHESTKKACIELIKTCWLTFAAVDILSSDISKPLSETNWKIIEINATPGIRMHHFSSEGESINVAWLLLAYLFSE